MLTHPLSGGTPNTARVSCARKAPNTVVNADPMPSPRAASMALQTAGKIDPPDDSPGANAKRRRGVCSKWSARYWAERTICRV